MKICLCMCVSRVLLCVPNQIKHFPQSWLVPHSFDSEDLKENACTMPFFKKSHFQITFTHFVNMQRNKLIVC